MLPDADKSTGSTPGVETPVTPDEPEVLDGGDGVEGFVEGDPLLYQLCTQVNVSA
jgi:hypothetical protein